MESRMGQTWARCSVLEGRWTHRFAPDLAPLRYARPVVFPLLSKPGWLDEPPRHERLRALSADFRFGGTVAGGERDLEAPGAGNRGARGFADTLWGCPQCQQRMQIHDYEERRWRHLDSCQFKTIIVSRVPNVRCPEHGSQTVAVPWAEKYTRFSRLFERLAIDVMLECSITGACSILGMSWDEADGIKQRAVKRGLARKVPAVMAHLCVDEKGMGRGQDYLTIVAQVTEQQTTVEYVGEERNQASLDAFWEALTVASLATIAQARPDTIPMPVTIPADAIWSS